MIILNNPLCRIICTLMLSLSLNGHAQYVGSEQCADCHQEAYQRWQQSHHWQAMQAANADSVLGDFNNTAFTHFSTTSTFFREGDAYFVRTDNAEGELETFKIDYTFGFHPLQQYLIAFEDGRYQALSIAWDSRPATEGGQRWFHLYPDEPIPHDDELHWTGAFQNWNTRCASCHSTNLQKNYDPTSDTFASEWSEINVACEACHGQGTQHLAWASGETSLANKGLSTNLTLGGQWQDGTGPTRILQEGDGQAQQLAACGGCHSRRTEFSHASPDKSFLDQYSPTLLLEGLYFPDGQIQDEVYVYGSFLQSKMHAAGVSCSNCHEPHSLKLRAEGNALCVQCHDATVFDNPKHHHHPVDSDGAQCVNCHMPERSYMVVDPRRDHSFTVPQPLLSELFNTPNACTGCHQDKDNAWAKSQLKEWLGHQPLRDTHTSTLAIARSGSPSALDSLLALANDEDAAVIVRATALQESGRFPGPQTLANAVEHLYSEKPLLRQAAVRTLEGLPVQQRYTLLEPLLDEPVKSVRLEMAIVLAGIDSNGLPAPKQQQLKALFDEYLEVQRFNADMPSVQLNLGIFYTAQGKLALAEKAYKHALVLSPKYLPAMLNLADLYRQQKRDGEARSVLQRAIDSFPNQAPAYHAMGLLLVRQHQADQSLSYLEKAAELSPETARYSYVYGVALHSQGKLSQAIAVLTEAAHQHPHSREIQGALDAYQKQAGGGG